MTYKVCRRDNEKEKTSLLPIDTDSCFSNIQVPILPSDWKTTGMFQGGMSQDKNFIFQTLLQLRLTM